ncbi:MAG TPA: DUF1385 domain-containing protein [Nitrolancea sp.]
MSEKTYYGGQAVMEGVMMRGRTTMAVAVRAPSGEIAVYHEELRGSNFAKRVRPLPFIRGVFMLWDTMVLGMRALVLSANVGLSEETDPAEETEIEEPQTLAGIALWGTVAVSIAFSIGLFFILPLVAISFLDRYISSSIVSNVIEGFIRLGLLIGYMLALRSIKDVRRVFMYHGAEHKTINAYEAGDPLDVEHVRRHSLQHTRCGTGFLLVVVLISIVIFAFLGRPDFLLRVASRIVFVPIIAAIAYEFIKWSAAHDTNSFVRILIAPSLALQRLTTSEPDASMLEVAIVSLKRVLVAEEAWAMSEIERPDIVAIDETGRELPVPEPAL